MFYQKDALKQEFQLMPKNNFFHTKLLKSPSATPA